MQDKTRNIIKQLGDTLFYIGLVISVVGILFRVWFSIGFILLAVIGYLISQMVATSDEPKILNLPPRPPFSIENMRDWARHAFKIIGHAIWIGLAIIALAFIATFALKNHFKQRNTSNELQEIANALEHYKLEKNSYPASLNDIISHNPLKREWRNDSWNNSIVYQSTSNSFQLISKGKDGIVQTADDIVVKN